MIWVLLFVWLFGVLGLAIGVAAQVTTLHQGHHAYLGTALVLLAGPLSLASALLGWVFLTLGALVTLDDGIEHGTAAAAGVDGAAWSPIHSWLVPWLYRFAWFKRFEAWADRLFAKPAP